MLVERLTKIWNDSKDLLPDEGRSTDALASLLQSARVDASGNAVFITHSVQGPTASVYVLNLEGTRPQAAREVLKRITQELELKRLSLYIPARLFRYKSAASRAGFRYEGTMRFGIVQDGEPASLDIFGFYSDGRRRRKKRRSTKSASALRSAGRSPQKRDSRRDEGSPSARGSAPRGGADRAASSSPA